MPPRSPTSTTARCGCPRSTARRRCASPRRWSTRRGAIDKWLDVAASDSGRIVAVRNEPGKTSRLSWFKVWEPDGTSTVEGQLNALNGWAHLRVSAELRPHGRRRAHGLRLLEQLLRHALATWHVRAAGLEQSLDPISISGQQHPTVFGNRVIAHSGTTIYAQDVGAVYGSDFTPWLNAADAGLRTATDRRRGQRPARGNRGRAVEWRDAHDRQDRCGLDRRGRSGPGGPRELLRARQRRRRGPVGVAGRAQHRLERRSGPQGRGRAR